LTWNHGLTRSEINSGRLVFNNGPGHKGFTAARSPQ